MMQGFMCGDCKAEFSAEDAKIVGMKCDMCSFGSTLVAIQNEELHHSKVPHDQGPLENSESPNVPCNAPPTLSAENKVNDVAQQHPQYRIRLKRPDTLDHNGVLVLEAIIYCNQPDARGNVWIEQRQSGLPGPSIAIDFIPAGDSYKTTAILEIHIESKSPTALRLVIEDDRDLGFQYRAEFAVQPAGNNLISIDLSDNRTINAGGNLEVLEGINERRVDLNELIGSRGDWEDLPLRRVAKKQLVRSTRQLDQLERPRLTLAQYDEKGQSYSIHLVCGKEIRLGRLEDDSPPNRNDIYLRCKEGGFNDKLFSRFHGMIQISESGIFYENVAASNGATVVVGNRIETIHENAEPIELLPNQVTTLVPGWTSRLTNEQLELELRPLSRFVLSEEYLVLNHSNPLESELKAFPQAPSGIAIRRSDDVPEEYLLFRSGFTIGKALDCGLVLKDQSIELHHAQIMFFDNGFWIEKTSPQATVRINDGEIAMNELVSLDPGARLRLGRLNLVAQSWKQHIVDCHCCPPQVD